MISTPPTALTVSRSISGIIVAERETYKCLLSFKSIRRNEKVPRLMCVVSSVLVGRPPLGATSTFCLSLALKPPFFTTVRVLIYTFIHSSRGRDCNYLSTQVRDGDDMRGYIICVIIVALRASLRCGQQKKMQASSRRCGVRGIV